MGFDRFSRMTVATLVLATLAAAPVYSQQKPAEERKLSNAEKERLQELSTLVDSVTAGKEPAPTDVKLRLQHHFVKSTVNVYVPYVLEISGGRFTSFPVAMYVRAVSKGASAPADSKAGYAFSDVYFISDAKRLRSTGGDAAEFSRGLQLPAGDFDVYIAMSEPPARNRSAAPPKRVVHTQAITVPDFSTAFTTSSIILARNLEDAPQQATAEKQLEDPFAFGGYRITPLFTPTLAKAAELLFVFFIYNEGADSSGKPDVEVNYFFSRAAEAKPFSKAPTTTFNASTLPPEFSLTSGHQLVVGQGIPLESFAPGDYKLELRITDKVKNQNITREIPFTVTQ